MESYTIQNLTFTYPSRQSPALCDVSVSIEAGRFVVLAGPSGCGKTTLLRRLKPVLAPHGEVSGSILFEGKPVEALGVRAQSAKIGFVMQSPENQIVTDKVWHELAFGLESLGYDTPSIRLRVAEMASFFGIQDWFHMPVTALSGGQKQLLSLASIMAMQPSVLILDEPTSQLDPIAASEFLAIIGKINRELGVTVIMTEHRLEEVFPLADRVIVMEHGRVLADGTPSEIGMALKGLDHGMFHAMPVPMRVYAAVENAYVCPVTVRDGREWLSHFEIQNPDWKRDKAQSQPVSTPSIALDEVWFRYAKDAPDVVKGLNFQAHAGEIAAILGGNGTGKTTTLSLIAGIHKPYRGTVRIEGRPLAETEGLFDGVLGVLPQNPQAIFVRKTVEEDLLEVLSDAKGLSKPEKLERMHVVVRLCRLGGLLRSHPYDLSGGEQQRAALAKVLLLRPRILLLDEPTKGLDAEFKIIFAGILRDLAGAGVTVVMISHDIEFCAEYADRCALFFDGSIASSGTPRGFFAGNSFYTSSANRMARTFLPEAVTAADIISALGGKTDAVTHKNEQASDLYTDQAQAELPVQKADAPEPWKKVCRVLSALCGFAAVILIALNFAGLLTLISGGREAASISPDAAEVWYGIAVVGALALAGILWALSRQDAEGFALQTAVGRRTLSKRTMAAAALALLAIPLTIYVGIYFLDDRRYYFISLLIILETMLPFVFIFESRKPQARELVIIAVLCAIGVVGRTAFFMLPQFKPAIAIIIISGVAFGGEAGFLVGAMTGFVSNMFFGQGPWTPWQMFAFGIIGFLAGVLFRKGILRRSRAALCIYGGLSTFILYGLIMNTSTLFTYQTSPTLAMLWPAILQGLPFDLIHGLATIVFLFIISRAMLEKLDRIKQKYGLVEL